MPPNDEEPTGGFSWRLRVTEESVRDLSRKVDAERSRGDERHEENRDKLDELGRKIERTSVEMAHLSQSVEKVGKVAWVVVGAVVAAITIAVLRLVGPSLGSSAELPKVEQPHP